MALHQAAANPAGMEPAQASGEHPAPAVPPPLAERLRLRQLGYARREKERARGFATGGRRVEALYAAAHGRVGKRRRLHSGDQAEDLPSEGDGPRPASPDEAEPDNPPIPEKDDGAVDPLVAAGGQPVVVWQPPRLIRPFAPRVPYGSRRLEQTLFGRRSLADRPLCPLTLATMTPPDLVRVMEEVGFLPDRPLCSACGAEFPLSHLRVKVRRSELRPTPTCAVTFPVETLSWRCPCRRSERSVQHGAELLNPRYSLRQSCSGRGHAPTSPLPTTWLWQPTSIGHPSCKAGGGKQARAEMQNGRTAGCSGCGGSWPRNNSGATPRNRSAGRASTWRWTKFPSEQKPSAALTGPWRCSGCGGSPLQSAGPGGWCSGSCHGARSTARAREEAAL